jgi:VAD1 Analog of StAR-related lipid transfer domain
LYAGTSGLYFYGKKFFWDVNVLLAFRSIKQVQLLTTTTRSNKADAGAHVSSSTSSARAIGITVLSKDGTVHDFCNIDNPRQVWAGLIVLQNENLTAIPRDVATASMPPTTVAASNQQQQPVRRTNSDPLMSSTQFKRTESAFSEFDDATDGNVAEETLLPNKATSAVSDTTTTISGSSSISSDMAQTWNDAVAKMANYSNLVVDKQVLQNCSLDQFVDLFVKNQADYSIAKYLQGRGDSELQETEWTTTTSTIDDGDSNINTANQTRMVHYMHPVNVPMAPPQAGARKEQAFCRYGDYGLVIETRTYVRDVPMTDCFYVVDRIRVEPNNYNNASSNKKNNNNESSSAAGEAALPSVLVSMEFQIDFVKSTMFRGIISKTTSSEFKSFFRDSKL